MDLFQKLNHKGQSPIAILDAPAELEAALTLPDGIVVQHDLATAAAPQFAPAFVTRQEAIERLTAVIATTMPDDPVVWFAYPKAGSKRYRCAFNRDTGWGALGQHGFEGVRQVSLNEDWSALRFRRVAYIKSFTRAAERAISAAGRQRLTQPDNSDKE